MVTPHENKSISIYGLKQFSNEKRLEALAKVGFEQDKEFEAPQALQKEHIDEMSSYVNMQAHTVFHPILPKCKPKEAEYEIAGSKEILESTFDLNIDTISYPNGDYSDRDIEISKAAGYRYGITVDYGYNTVTTDRFRLKRISANDTDDLNELIVKASGVWAFIKTRNGRKQTFGHSQSPET